ncbi:MAG: prolyl oligopeptidase family serine peptidase [Bacteroidales bacterium]|nr:prolyl oligopeptidase family serine peptidase [Bacteroidales bacterium]MDD3990137.1 prolyl oligopeptidase family serine peptidase [Bacteroidales bacterium]
MSNFLYALFLCLPLLAGRELSAQSKHDSLQKIVTGRFYNIAAPRMSEDGKFTILRKRSWLPAWDKSDLDKDSIILFDLRHPELFRIAAFRQGIRDLTFAGNTHLLLSDSSRTELLNLNEQTSIYYKNVKNSRALKSKKQFLLHYNVNDRLELYDNNGGLLNGLDHVKRFYITDSDNVYVIAEDGEKGYIVALLADKKTEKLYKSSHMIESLEIDPGEEGMMVFEQNAESKSQGVVYLNLKDKMSFPLKEVLPVNIQRGFTEVIREGSLYFVTTTTEKEEPDNAVVDIWYGTDNRLEEKFYPPDNLSAYVWDPSYHSIKQIGNDQFPVNLYIGSDRYFLSFDPDLLQDYTTESVPLKVYVYDREQDRHFILDTVPKKFYISCNGEYALSPKKQEWYLYHIPSGSKKLMPGKGMDTPWFTDDGNAVLFEAQDALWKYDIQSGMLSEAVVCKGYKTSIINGEWDVINGNGLYKQQVNLLKPIVIKQYDRQENVTSYVIWHNGKSETIIPPTARYIQSLIYNNSFDSFTWIEEDYNMPPRFVYKKIGEKERVLYLSNKQDKEILTLKQEVIQYTNSDSIPLQGVLYYPLNYDPYQKYPMVVLIYERQRHLSNRYPYPFYYDGLGFNIRLLIDQGYFVYLPDIYIQGKEDKGAGIDALDCVHKALDAVSGNLSIDKSKIGLTGHSFGGYETDFIATHSSRFAAYVSGSGHSDILQAYHSFNYNFHFPDYVRIEANQYKMGVPFTRNKTLYFKNNPIYYAENVNAPVLLWSGLEDKNVTSDGSIAFYNALRRNGKSVVALFYKGEGHGLRNQKAQFDLTSRILDWFDYFLKGDTNIEWISKEIKKDAK